ncbi:MAG: hypothetical protein J0M24_07395 [Verrucomicrobia bacterium]|nr:hypothetical protein [Verrucomicrobiota bacterium]
MTFQDELQEGMTVSLWAGDLATADEVTGYLGQPFEREFGFLLDRDDLPWISFQPSQAPFTSRRNPQLEKVPVRELLDAIPWATEWAAEAEKSCIAAGIPTARVVLAFPHLRFRREQPQTPQPSLTHVGCFAWPGGQADWDERKAAEIILPPLPRLRRTCFGEGELYSWSGRVFLDAWKGFATREQIAGEGAGSRFSARPDGNLVLEVESPNIRLREFRPSAAQIRSFEEIVTRQRTLRDTILEAIHSEYEAWRRSWAEDELFPIDRMPPVDSLNGLMDLIRPGTLHLQCHEEAGYVKWGIEFACRWDEEHGLGVSLHRDRVLAVGEADCAFS